MGGRGDDGVAKEILDRKREVRGGLLAAREDCGHTAALHFLGSFLRACNTFLHGDGILGATIGDCVTHRVTTLTSSRFRRTLRLARSSGGRLGGNSGPSLEDGYRSFKNFDPIVVGVKHVGNIQEQGVDEPPNPFNKNLNNGGNPLFVHEIGWGVEHLDNQMLINGRVYVYGGRERHDFVDEVGSTCVRNRG